MSERLGIGEMAMAFRDTFETSKAGQLVLENLVARFGRAPYVAGGLEGARETDYRAGQLSVVQAILSHINRANGAPEEQP